MGSASVIQAQAVVEPGATIRVRTNDAIDAGDGNRRVFSGTLEQDLLNRNGRVAVARGSEVRMTAREVSRNEMAVDLNSLIVNGERYNVSSGAQIVGRGRRAYIPANSVLTFRLDEPLRIGMAEPNGRYKPGYNDDDDYQSNPAFRAGIAAGRADAERNLPRDPRSNRWTSRMDRRDYEAGYNRGYESRVGAPNQDRGSVPNPGPVPSGRVHIGGDKNISWQAPAAARVYVQVDNNPVQLFAEAPSGTQAAPWIEQGHVYVFMLRDMSGREISRDVLDLRR